MKNTRILRRTRRAGLTLIELIVVLTILIALGGIAATVAPDLLGTAHVAEHATNNATVEQAVQINRFTNASIGDRFDSLTDGTNVYGGVPAFDAATTTYQLTAEDVAALNAIGVSAVFDGAATVTNATFEYADYTTAPRTLAATGVVCRFDESDADLDAVLARFNAGTAQATSRYVLLGVGPGCTLVGASGAIAEAPVHFADDAGNRPDQAYARYCVLVELQGAGAAGASARLLGTGVLHAGEGLVRGGQALAEFYE